MDFFMEFLNQNLAYAVFVLMAVTIILIIAVIVCIVKILKLKKKISPDISDKEETLEGRIVEFETKSKEIQEKYDRMIEALMDMNNNINKCVQKVGVIRYNPFPESGGNLCYAVALLDSENNGVVLNGIHSRSGCFTYAKPIELGVSEYVLSQEEKQAIERAMNGSYTSDEREAIMKEIKKQYEEDILPSRLKKKKKGHVPFVKKEHKPSEI
ncbi:MAG: DUF4446 family protein [Clostridia bacterium]|nr:DUF4446 family protein [Clostridia bacterium]